LRLHLLFFYLSFLLQYSKKEFIFIGHFCVFVLNLYKNNVLLSLLTAYFYVFFSKEDN
jgi:hypothetical protein